MFYKKGDKLDLHIHSAYSSDGKYSLVELLTMAEEKKLDVISFTDHNDLSIYDELKTIDYKKYFSGKIVNGVEINVTYDGNLVEALVYDFNLEKMKSFWFLNKDNLIRVQKETGAFVAEKYRKLGLIIDDDFVDDITVNGPYVLYEEIIKHKQNLWFLKKCKITHFGYFYRKVLLNKRSKYYVDLSAFFPHLDDLHDIAKNAGGITILAHPFGQYDIASPKLFINKVIKNHAVDGLECIHRTISKSESTYLLKLCDKYNLVKTAGSDFHRMGHMMGKSKKSGLDTIIY